MDVAEKPFVSTLNVPPAPKRSTLDARRVMCQKFHDAPTIKQLERHAERYGTEQVVETAIELGYGIETVTRLQDFCDRVEAANYKKQHPRARPMRFPNTEKRVKALMEIVDEEEEAVS